MINTWHCSKATDVPIVLFLAEFSLRVDVSINVLRRYEKEIYRVV
jgi:hypothetical protein